MRYLVPVLSARTFAATQPACPSRTLGFKSHPVEESIAANVHFENEAPVPVKAMWVSFFGEEKDAVIINAHEITALTSYVGHAFRFYTLTESPSLVLEYRVTGAQTQPPVPIQNCGDIGKGVVEIDRSEYFGSLVHKSDAPCLPDSDSSHWSCVRQISQQDYQNLPKSLYGFADGETSGNQQVGATIDTGYTSHIPLMPRVADGLGYLVMNFTQTLRDILLQFYEERKVDSIVKFPSIGGYLNDYVHQFDVVDLDDFPDVHSAINKEMRQIMQWWTKRKLVHTATRGVQIYRRHAMLINHVDRADTHVASAVLQVAQDVDHAAGWPLEVFESDCKGNAGGTYNEVYLQPGQLVLYEGSKFFHGRPMRFRGNEFANVFVHFKPKGWQGPERADL